jgi:methionine sulfoxide reductase heme-binding subunit
LTAVVVLGVLEVSRVSSESWPRFLIDGVHRRLSILAIVFLIVHIVTSVLDSFAPIGWLDAVIPFHSSYRPIWLGLGAVAFDLMLAVFISSLVRARIGHGSWRAIHWLAYASWPIAVIHGFGTGSDSTRGWMLILDLVCIAAVISAIAFRVLTTPELTPAMRTTAIGTCLAFALGLAIWLPGGPLAAGWAARAGTPPSLLPHTAASGNSR